MKKMNNKKSSNGCLDKRVDALEDEINDKKGEFLHYLIWKKHVFLLGSNKEGCLLCAGESYRSVCDKPLNDEELHAFAEEHQDYLIILCLITGESMEYNDFKPIELWNKATEEKRKTQPWLDKEEWFVFEGYKDE